MSDTTRRPELHLTRRELLAATAALAIPGILRADPSGPKYALPGPYRGRVIEVMHPGSVVDGKVRQEAVRDMMARGMTALTGAQDEASAWKKFFGPGDVVAIKGSPVGRPHSISQPETLLQVINGLMLAGVKPENIVMYERYGEEMLAAGFDKLAPKGGQIGYGAAKYDDIQTSVDGYDPTTFVEFPFVMAGQDPAVPVNHRSHLNLVISNKVNKVVNVCTLKDHASAGITMALKNMSHGFNNNVCRTHFNSKNNTCGTFIPAMVAMPKIREKVVLHIGDGLIGTFDGGPGIWNPHFKTWEYRTLFFATDPVAMDRVGWSIIDAKRTEAKLPVLAETGIALTNPGMLETFDKRQPEHVLIAGQLGLGEADLNKIIHRKFTCA